MLRCAGLLMLTMLVAAVGESSLAANASLTCVPAPGMRIVMRASDYPTSARAEAVVRARCQEAALRVRGQTSERHNRGAFAMSPEGLSREGLRPTRDIACQRYPNLC
jgi:hypothetical protein